jgi:O-acetyl-ADP-ribose deacetylase (regulator of RNase III)
MYKEIDGDLIVLAKEGKFDVISHGCNCLCTMRSGIAPQMDKAFGCNSYEMEKPQHAGDINKLGTIDWETRYSTNGRPFEVVNSYTQFYHGKHHTDGVTHPLDYNALILCMKKINYMFKGQHIGLPRIGAGLAGGDWNKIREIIQYELKDCDVTVVNYKKD